MIRHGRGGGLHLAGGQGGGGADPDGEKAFGTITLRAGGNTLR